MLSRKKVVTKNNRANHLYEFFAIVSKEKKEDDEQFVVMEDEK